MKMIEHLFDFRMIKLLLLFILSLTVSSQVFGLSATQKNEMQKTIKNMQSLMPRRIDAMTTMTWTWMEDNTWYMNTQINTGGRAKANCNLSRLNSLLYAIFTVF